MIGRVRGRLNSPCGSRRVRHYFCQSAGRGFYLMEEKPLRGKGKGMLLVGSYAFFVKNYGKFCDRLFRWRDRERKRSVRWKQTRGEFHFCGGELKHEGHGLSIVS